MSEGGSGEARTPGDIAGLLRAAADRITAGWSAAAANSPAGLGPAGVARMPTMPTMPASMSAHQLEVFLNDLASRRAQVQALKTQLEEFDKQLGTLEASVKPLVEWTRTLADLEKTMSQFWRFPSAGTKS